MINMASQIVFLHDFKSVKLRFFSCAIRNLNRELRIIFRPDLKKFPLHFISKSSLWKRFVMNNLASKFSVNMQFENMLSEQTRLHQPVSPSIHYGSYILYFTLTKCSSFIRVG